MRRRCSRHARVAYLANVRFRPFLASLIGRWGHEASALTQRESTILAAGPGGGTGLAESMRAAVGE